MPIEAFAGIRQLLADAYFGCGRPAASLVARRVWPDFDDLRRCSGNAGRKARPKVHQLRPHWMEFAPKSADVAANFGSGKNLGQSRRNDCEGHDERPRLPARCWNASGPLWQHSHEAIGEVAEDCDRSPWPRIVQPPAEAENYNSSKGSDNDRKLWCVAIAIHGAYIVQLDMQEVCKGYHVRVDLTSRPAKKNKMMQAISTRFRRSMLSWNRMQRQAWLLRSSARPWAIRVVIRTACSTSRVARAVSALFRLLQKTWCYSGSRGGIVARQARFVTQMRPPYRERGSRANRRKTHLQPICKSATCCNVVLWRTPDEAIARQWWSGRQYVLRIALRLQ